MSDRLAPSARLVWSLAGAPGLSSAIDGDGNSGGWPNVQLTPGVINKMTPVDLRDVNDVTLMVAIAEIDSETSFAAGLSVFDNEGNLYALGLKTTALTAAGTALVSGGIHGQSAAYAAFPSWGQVWWTCSGGSVAGAEIELWGR